MLESLEIATPHQPKKLLPGTGKCCEDEALRRLLVWP